MKSLTLPSPQTHRHRLVLIIMLSTIGLVLGLILLMLSLQRIFFSSWHNSIIFGSSCPSHQSINFLARVPVFQLIFIIALGVSILVFALMLCMSLYCIFNIKRWYHYWNKLHIVYSSIISIGILAAIVVLLYVLKLFINCNAVKNYYNDGTINSQCFSQNSYAFLQDKMSTLIILLVLAGIMLLCYVFYVMLLPSRFLVGQDPYQVKKNKMLIGKLPVALGKDQISRNQILVQVNNDDDALVPMLAQNKTIKTSTMAINTGPQLLLTKNYKNKLIQVDTTDDALLVNKNNKIQTKQIATQTNPNPQMKNIKIQVDIAIPTTQKIQQQDKQKPVVNVGVWTGDGLYTIKNSGVQAVNQTQYRSFGIGQYNLEQSETEYKSCGVGDENIWGPQYVIQKLLQNQQKPKYNNKPTRLKNNNYIQSYKQQSQITRQNNKIPVSRSIKTQTPLSKQSGYYYYTDKKQKGQKGQRQRQQPKLNAMMKVQQSTQRPRINRNQKSQIEEKSQQYHDATVLHTNSQFKKNKEQYEQIHYSETPSARSIRVQKMKKLRQRFQHKINSRPQLQQQQSGSQPGDSKNPAKSKLNNKNLKIDDFFMQKQRQQLQQNQKYKRQMMGDYMLKAQHTPHKNQLHDKGQIPQYLKIQLNKANKRSNSSSDRICNVLQPGTWCSGAWCE